MSLTRAELLDRLLEKKGIAPRSDESLIPRRSDRTDAPLSFAQERLWFIDRLEPSGPLYNIARAVRMEGHLSVGALSRGVDRVVERHEVLRTTYRQEDGAPLQVVTPARRVPLPLVDLGGLPEEGRSRELRKRIAAISAEPFDLERGPVFRTGLFRVSSEEHVLLLSLHHICGDGWSLGLLVRELGELYRAGLEERAAELPALPVQYGDFAAWQRERLTDDSLREDVEWWRARLDEVPRVLDLPTDRPRPLVGGHRGDVCSVLLDRCSTGGLQELGRARRATPFMTTLALLAVLLHRYTGQESMALGTPLAGRERSELEPLIGFFVKTLVVRVDVKDADAFGELVARTRDETLAAQSRREVPFERLVQELRPERSLGHSPLFQVMVAYQNVPRAQASLGNLQVEPVTVPTTTEKFDLTIALAERSGRLAVHAGYRSDLFDRTTILRMLGHFETLARAVTEDWDASVASLPLMPRSEAHQVVLEWSEQRTSTRSPELAHPQIRTRAEEVPDRLALQLGHRSVTYGELARRSSSLAWRLRSAGVGPEVPVGVVLEHGIGLAVALLATLEAGGVYVPLDPALPEGRLEWMASDAGVEVLVVDDRSHGHIDGGRRERVLLEEPASTGGAGTPSWSGPAADPECLAYVIYTSGSTGTPKGVGVSRRALSEHCRATIRDRRLGPEDRVLAFAAPGFDVSLEELLPALIVGATVELRGRELWSPRELATRCDALRVTVTNLPTAFWSQWTRHQEDSGPVGDTLRLVLAGGEAMPAHALERWRRGPLTNVLLLNAYGPTETVITATREVAGERASPGPVVPVGRALPERSARVVDRRGRAVPIGVPGELWLGGLVARGYAGRAASTAERFVPDPFSESAGARLYRTGDLVRRLGDGRLEFLRRIDRQVKVRGYRIEPGEVEASLTQHPRVAEAVVLAVGTEDQRHLVAFVTTSRPWPGGQDALRRHLGRHLPPYALPSEVIFLDALPTTSTGKVDHRTLETALEERAGRRLGRAAVRPPETVTQRLLADVWSELLGVEEVGLEDDFFALGGHSLLATRVVARIRNVFGLELAVRELFEAPTLEELGRRVDAHLIGEDEQEIPSLAEFRGASDPTGAPLSFAQERLWFIAQLEPESPAYNMPQAIRFRGGLEPGVLWKALGELVRRHEVLRTVFHVHGGEPRQVLRNREPPLPVIDLSALPESTREAEGSRLEAEEAARPFDLSASLMLRASLVARARESWTLLLTLHHIASDGWSMGILKDELASAVRSLQVGERPDLPELPLQYRDFATWQREWLSGAVLRRELEWWCTELAGLPPVLELPSDRPRPPIQSYRGRTRPLRLSSELAEGLRALARGEGATLFMVLMAGFQALLARYSGQDDLAVGYPVAGRTGVEVEPLIGLFVNTLVLRGDLSGGPTFRELIGRVRSRALDAHAHQHLPFERLVEEMEPERSLAHAPIFQVMMVLQNAPRQSARLRGVEMQGVSSAAHSAKFDLLLALAEGADGVGGAIEYSTDLFDHTTVHRFALHMRRLLEAAILDPDAPALETSLLSAEERSQLLFEWNDTEGDPLRLKTVRGMFSRASERWPEAVAVTVDGRSLSYGELGRRAHGLAQRLRGYGVGPEVPVAIDATRTVSTLVAVLGVIEAGGAYLPLDPAYPEARIRFMLKDAAAPILLTRSGGMEGLRREVDTVIELDRLEVGPRLVSGGAPATTGESLVYLIYTSGSTGRPKGVGMRQGALARLISWQLDQSAAGVGRTLQFAPLSFDVSFQEMFATWGCGGTLVLVDPETRRDPRLLVESLDRERVERLFLPFVALEQLAEEAVRTGRIPPLHEIVTAGEQLRSTPAVVAFLERLGDCRLENQYGPTETHVVTAWRQEGSPSRMPSLPPIGRPVAGSRVHVVDPQGDLVPPGVAGELCVAGASPARGYLHRPAATAERFVPDPFGNVPGGRLYRTGDLGRHLSDGQIEFLGRADRQVKVRGFRVEPGEIEAVLSRHPRIREVAVTVVGRDRLSAYVVAAGEVAPSAREVRDFVGGRLPEYMIPTFVVPMDELPLTPSGKVDRGALPGPGMQRTDNGPPGGQYEVLMAEIWAEVLEVDGVGSGDDFFHLGGHSLMATRVTSRIRDAFGVDLPVRALFEHSTLADLSAVVERAKGTPGSEAPPIEPVSRSQPLPLSFSQRRLWFIDRLQPGGAVFNLPLGVRIDGPVDLRALTRAIDRLVRRHETLRTRFVEADGEPVQTVDPPSPTAVPVVDLGGLPVAVREREALRVARREGGDPFDLERPPHLRARVLRLAPEDHGLLLTVHHIVADGWSLEVVKEELGALYRASVDESELHLPELPLQYADFAAWQRRTLGRGELQSALDYWTERLRDLPPEHGLPTDHPRPRMSSQRGRSVAIPLEPMLTPRLTDLARQQRATLFMVMLAAFKTLLHRYAGRDEVTVGTPVSGRDRPELEGVVGLFVNNLVLRSDVSGEPSFVELLGRVREVTLDAFAHREIPFEMLVEEVQPERSLSRNPLFQVMLAFQNLPRASFRPAPGVEMGTMPVGGGQSQFDLGLVAEQRGDDLVATLTVSADLWDHTSAVRMAGHLRALLHAAVALPEQPLGALPLLGPAERHQLLVEWNDRAAPVGDPPVHELVRRRAEVVPEAVAVVDREEQITFRELLRRADALSSELRAAGTGPESLVGVCLRRSADLPVALLGVLRAGAAYVPIDPDYPERRIEAMVESAGLAALVTDATTPQALAPSATEIQRVELDSLRRRRSAVAPAAPDARVFPENLAYVIFTSGSTGRPKGVQIPHGALSNFLLSMARRPGLRNHETLLAVTTPSFDISALELFLPLVIGAKVVIAKRDVSFSAGPIHELMCDERVTVAQGTPATWRLFLDEGRRIPDGLEVLCGGEALPRDLADRLLAEGAYLWNMYGPTETTIWSSVREVGPGTGPVSVGGPIDGTSFYVMSRSLRPSPVGVPGELSIGGVGLARGYRGSPAQTAERFVPDPAASREAPGARMYRTGDLVRRGWNGTLWFLGRIDDQVKVRGFRIELGEIEAVLRGHPRVSRAVAVAREITPGDTRLAAYYVSESRAVDRTELEAFLGRRLPGYMIPSSFTRLEALPETPNGKIDRSALPVPRAESFGRREMVQPRNRIEHELVEIWEELLEIGTLGIDDDFFSLGGHSLLGVRMLAQVRDRFGIAPSPALLFERGTVRQLAAYLQRGVDRDAASPLVRLRRGDRYPPVAFVHPVGGTVLCYAELARHLRGGVPFYGLQRTGTGRGGGEPVTVESLAAEYVRALREKHSKEPCLLGGWSMGGVVAFEMARQLESTGGPPLVGLILVDSLAVHPVPAPEPLDLIRAFAEELRIVSGLEIPRNIDVARTYRKGMSEGDLFEKLLDEVIDRGSLPPDLGLALKDRFAVFRENHRALRRYRPRGVDLPALLLRTEETGRIAGEPTLGWERFVGDKLEVVDIPGDHYSIMKTPQVAALAEAIRSSLDRSGLRE